MQFYSKLIAAVIGLAVLIGSRYGLDLAQSEQVIIDAVVSIATAVGVLLAKNKPTTPAQIQKASNAVDDAVRDAADKQ